jgi:hypothetical protein
MRYWLHSDERPEWREIVCELAHYSVLQGDIRYSHRDGLYVYYDLVGRPRR